MSTRMVEKQRPAKRMQGRKQRLDYRGFPPTGLPWGQPGWPNGEGGGGAGDPHINSLTPSTLAATAGATTITVAGTNFEEGSVIEIDHVAVPTTFVSATSLTTSFDPTVAGTLVFTVRNPNEEESNSVNFVVTGVGAANTKAEITAWLIEQGVTLSESALMNLTKDELLAIVVDILDGEVDPGDVVVP